MKKLNFKITEEYIGLSNEEKPTNVKDGSTFYEVDTGDTAVFYNGEWYKPDVDSEVE